jgi:predicted permease
MLSFPLLAGNSITNRIVAVGQASQTDQDPTCYVLPIGPRFFETMGMTLLSGRDFSAADDRKPDQSQPGAAGEPTQPTSAADAPILAVINQSMAHQFFPNEDPIGKRFTYEGGPGKKTIHEVIGLVSDAKYTTIREPAPKTYYVSYFQQPGNFDMTFQLKTLGSVSGLGADIQHALSELDPGLRVSGLQTMNDLIDQSLNQERFIAQIAGFFSLFALLLASVGLYGIMSHNVSRRTNEIGIRMALGALRGDVVWMVMRETMIMVTLGVVIGLGAAIATTRFIESFLFGLTATDPVTIAAAVLVMLAVAAAAGYLPARRASSVDPMIALRYE